MFKSILVKNGIKHNNVMFSFKEGITAITGPNGCGKSLLVEYMGFVLFGVKALRLPAEKYKGLSVEAYVIIKDVEYKINRTTSSCSISLDDQVICTGTKPCNLKIIELLGYNYTVYQMGNYAAQFQITEFGKLTPAERKKAVDQVLGLGIIDSLIKYTNDEGNKYLSEAKGIESVIAVPTKPEAPEGISNEKALEEQFEATKSIIDRKTMLRYLKEQLGTMATPSKPIKPEGGENLTASEVKDILSKKRLFEHQISELERKIKPSFTAEQLDNIEKEWEAYEAYQSYQDKLFMVPKAKPEISLEEALDGKTRWYEYNLYMDKQKELITCPICQAKFTLAGNVETAEKPIAPKKTEAYYTEQVELNRIWENVVIPEPVPEAKQPVLNKYGINAQRQMIKDWKEVEENLPALKAEVDKYANITDLLFAQLQAYELAEVSYESDIKAWKEYIDKSIEYQKELDQLEKLGDVDKIHSYLFETLEKIKRYRVQETIYENALVEYENKRNYLETTKAKGNNYKLASDRLKEMKVKMKQYVLPSLARMASRLLSEMSEGQYNSVEIDDNFDITLNGLEIAGYSGSEQAMANLAIRIALGQVLTHKSFNVFIGDEIDSSMRPERAQATADCLKRLSKYIKQIILVSHRDIEADNYINLGE